MKKMLNNKLFYFLLGAILFSGITVFAYSITSKEISFTPENTNWEVTNVEEAINDLYNYKINDIELAQSGDFEAKSSAAISGFTIDSYYFCIANMRNNVTTYSISDSEIMFGLPYLSFLDSRYTNYHLYFKAKSETITFSFPGASGFGILCYSVRK